MLAIDEGGSYLAKFFNKNSASRCECFIPAVHVRYLFLASGLLWSFAGLFLNRLPIGWMLHGNYSYKFLYIITGVLIGLLIHIFGFNKVANKNIARIEAKGEGKACIFSFMSISSYLIVIFMMSLGIFMRNIGYIPKNLLSILYLGIGTGLFLSSFKYYIRFFKTFKKA